MTHTKPRRPGISFRNSHGSLKTRNISVSYCTVYENGGTGIHCGSGVNMGTISHNTAHNNNWGPAADTAGIRLWGNLIDENGMIVEYNTSYGNYQINQGGSGIYFDEVGAYPPPIMRFNIVYNNGLSGLFVEHSNGVEIYYNVSYGNSSKGIHLYRDVRNVSVYNNVCYGNLFGISLTGIGLRERGMIGNKIKNNICFGNTSRELRVFWGGENDGTMGSGNIYTHNSFGPERSKFIEWGQGVTKSTYADWEAAYGGSTHSIKGDPVFVNGKRGDFHLEAGSPAIDVGADVGLTKDYDGTHVPQGNAVDVGAYEFVYESNKMNFPLDLKSR